MDLLDAIKKRRSIREFKNDEIPEEVLSSILECARMAPSAGGLQPWIFVMVKEQRIKRELRKAAGDQPQVEEAPVVIVVCGDPEISAARYQDRGRSLYVFQDTAAAVQNILLASTAFGLGSCWVGAFEEGRVRKALDLPTSLRPLAMLPIGYSDEVPGPRELRPAQEVMWVR